MVENHELALNLESHHFMSINFSNHAYKGTLYPYKRDSWYPVQGQDMLQCKGL